ncbi:aspartic peptidase domain-containing protein [Nemania sp. NC0429]|nr:aspartic peptidase domain-containing protein [Nemania sp. NC0429]
MLMRFWQCRRTRRQVIAGLFLTYQAIDNFVAAQCVPYPVAVVIGNVSLSNGQLARGAKLSVGNPPQSFAFLPQWPLNNTAVYGTNGYCTDPAPRSEAACTTWRGGQYNILASDTRRKPPNDPNPIDGSPYPTTTTYTDVFTVNDNVTFDNFAFQVPLSDWLEQGYHPMMAIGLGANSTILTALKKSNLIASRVWSMFFGWTGANPNAQQDGTLVFGGYDRAKVSGKGYTRRLQSDPRCSTQMLVTIDDIILHFPNGTDTSIVTSTSNGSFPACLVPDFPGLMTLASNPYFSKFEEHTNTSIQERTYGAEYYTVLYNDGDEPYSGDMSINIKNGPSIRIPNSQLVVPERYISETKGQSAANYSRSNLVINPLQDVNSKDLSQLGRQFFSSAYIMMNQDNGEFTIWSANPTSVKDLVAVDGTGKLVTDFCSNTTVPAPSQGPTNLSTTRTQAGLSTGAIAGIVVGVVAALVTVIGAWLLRRRRREASVMSKPATRGTIHQVTDDHYKDPYHPIYTYKFRKPETGELQGFGLVSELAETGERGQSASLSHSERRYELGG